MPYRTMTVNEIIEQLSKLPGDKLIELKSVIDPDSFQSELHIILLMEPTQYIVKRKLK